MKYRHIATVLIALSLIVVTFVGTVAAAVIDLPVPPVFEKTKGKYFTWTISTTSYFSGLDVIKATVKLTYWDNKNVMSEFYPPTSNIVLTASTIVISLTTQDVPNHASAYNIQGDLLNGDSFLATGPGWGWGNIHQ